MKKIIKLLFVCLLATHFSIIASATNENLPNTQQPNIIGIETSHFFNDIYGTFYIYFGRPTCPECIEFESHLKDFLKDNNQVVYYYNTSYWKSDGQFDSILSKYHVDSVPLLVKTVNGDYRETYLFDPNATPEEIKSQLEDFFLLKSKTFPVTEENNFPVQFHDYLFAYTFVIMCINVCYLLFSRKDLMTTMCKAPLIWVIANSTLLFALHIAIAGFGFGFAMHYEATPSTSLFAKIGTYTWLTATPLLYLVTLVLSMRIIINQNESKQK